ncbi:MAG: hypothetical protein ACRD0Q_02390 [Acidimicrobiales bacterium]
MAAASDADLLAASDSDVEYDLGDWGAADRGAVTAALSGEAIPYRWEAELVLAVPAAAEGEADRLVDDIEGSGRDVPDEAELVEEGDGADGADGGEEAQAAMADLFVAADRVQHSPPNDALAAELTKAATTVGLSLPPYGIEGAVWRKAQELASTAVAALQAPDEEVVAANARAVRDFLRPYV